MVVKRGSEYFMFAEGAHDQAQLMKSTDGGDTDELRDTSDSLDTGESERTSQMCGLPLVARYQLIGFRKFNDKSNGQLRLASESFSSYFSSFRFIDKSSGC